MSQPKFMESLNLVVHHATALHHLSNTPQQAVLFLGVTSPRVPRHLAFHWCRSSYIRFGGATTAATTMEEGEFHDLRSKTLYLLTSILSLKHWQAKHEPTVFCWLKQNQKGVSPRFSVRRTLSKNFGWLLMKQDQIAFLQSYGLDVLRVQQTFIFISGIEASSRPNSKHSLGNLPLSRSYTMRQKISTLNISAANGRKHYSNKKTWECQTNCAYFVGDSNDNVNHLKWQYQPSTLYTVSKASKALHKPYNSWVQKSSKWRW